MLQNFKPHVTLHVKVQKTTYPWMDHMWNVQKHKILLNISIFSRTTWTLFSALHYFNNYDNYKSLAKLTVPQTLHLFITAQSDLLRLLLFLYWTRIWSWKILHSAQVKQAAAVRVGKPSGLNSFHWLESHWKLGAKRSPLVSLMSQHDVN